jgi:hypothetical protein
MPISGCTTITYCLDRNDLITHVNSAWADFALANDAPDIARRVVGTDLWRHLSGEEVIAFYHDLMAHVRRTGQVFSLPFRCDAADVRRQMRLTIEPLHEGGLFFESRTLSEIPRRALHLFDTTVPRTEEVAPLCVMCQRLQNGDWRDADQYASRMGWTVRSNTPKVTHRVCERCQSLSPAARAVSMIPKIPLFERS